MGIGSYLWPLIFFLPFYWILGPCPPCPKMVTTTCYCKKAKPIPRRCSTKEWSCQQACGRKLLCGQHKCENPCHAGERPYLLVKVQAVSIAFIMYQCWFIIVILGSCPPCPRVSRQKCVCGKQVTERSCASPLWHCDQVSVHAFWGRGC